MKRDLPFSVEEEVVEETPRSMLASRTVWIGGVLSLAAWGLLAAWLLRWPRARRCRAPAAEARPQRASRNRHRLFPHLSAVSRLLTPIAFARVRLSTLR